MRSMLSEESGNSRRRAGQAMKFRRFGLFLFLCFVATAVVAAALSLNLLAPARASNGGSIDLNQLNKDVMSNVKIAHNHGSGAPSMPAPSSQLRPSSPRAFLFPSTMSAPGWIRARRVP